MREHVLRERRDRGRRVAERLAEVLGSAGCGNALEHFPDRPRKRLGRVECLAAQARGQLGAALLEGVGARTECAGGVRELIHVAGARHAQPLAVGRGGECRRLRGLECRAELGPALADERGARSAACASPPHRARARPPRPVSQVPRGIAASRTRRHIRERQPSPSIAIQPSSGTWSSSRSPSSSGQSAHRNTRPRSKGSATSTPTTASPALANGLAAVAAASS